jgi:hypothetical protein
MQVDWAESRIDSPHHAQLTAEPWLLARVTDDHLNIRGVPLVMRQQHQIGRIPAPASGRGRMIGRGGVAGARGHGRVAQARRGGRIAGWWRGLIAAGSRRRRRGHVAVARRRRRLIGGWRGWGLIRRVILRVVDAARGGGSVGTAGRLLAIVGGWGARIVVGRWRCVVKVVVFKLARLGRGVAKNLNRYRYYASRKFDQVYKDTYEMNKKLQCGILEQDS